MTIDVVRKTFTDWAPRYDATHAWLPYRRKARLALDVQRGDHVLDLACGTGLNFPHLRGLVGGEGHITGVDLVPAMLDIARQRIAQHGWRNVQVREADAARLPFPDASFDRAICSYSMNIIPDYMQAIAEVERLLVRGGRFVVLDIKLNDSILTRWPKLTPFFVRAMHICMVDITHQPIDKLRRVFADVQVREHWRGFFFIAVGIKG